MKKTIIALLVLATVLLVAGCTTNAEQSRYDYDYVPTYAGAGCGFAATQTTPIDTYGLVSTDEKRAQLSF